MIEILGMVDSGLLIPYIMLRMKTNQKLRFSLFLTECKWTSRLKCLLEIITANFYRLSKRWSGFMLTANTLSILYKIRRNIMILHRFCRFERMNLYMKYISKFIYHK